jgi:hypothetical protein
MHLMQAASITWPVKGCWALEIEIFGSCKMASSRKASAIWGANEFFGPEMALAYRLDA